MHGGWCWRDVGRRLTSAGHEVHAPTLTGQGDRRRGRTASTCLTTHVDDVSDRLWFEDLTGVHLVLHSYAGMLAGPLAERTGDRLASVVYLGAFVGEPGECLLDVEPAATAERYRTLAADGGGVVPASDAFLDQWGVTDPDLRTRVSPRLVDFPLGCATEPAVYDPAPLAALRKVYVEHTDPPLPGLARSIGRAVEAGWEFHRIAGGHDLMLAAPAETAGLLASLAGDR
jgi:pimeloyl-ACP methyl ester carboxylesterase